MLLALICREAIDARTRLLAGLFTQVVAVSVLGLAIALGFMAYDVGTQALGGVGLAIAAVALMLSLVVACVPMGRVVMGRLMSDSAAMRIRHEGFFWRASWVLLVTGLLGLSLPVWTTLLAQFDLGKAMVMLGICFLAVGALFANQWEHMRGGER